MRKGKAKVASRYPTPALEKGLDILELFAREPAGLTKSDVSRRLGRTVSEIFRMLVCLEERGYISPSRDGERFHLTLRQVLVQVAEGIRIYKEVLHKHIPASVPFYPLGNRTSLTAKQH